MLPSTLFTANALLFLYAEQETSHRKTAVPMHTTSLLLSNCFFLGRLNHTHSVSDTAVVNVITAVFCDQKPIFCSWLKLFFTRYLTAPPKVVLASKFLMLFVSVETLYSLKINCSMRICYKIHRLSYN